MRTDRRSRLLLIAVVALSSLVVAGCRGDGPSPTEVVAASSEKTLAAKSSRVAFTVATAGADVEAGFRADGVFDYETRVGQLVLDLSGLGLAPTDQGAAPTQVEIVLTETVFYMKVPDVPGAAGRYPKPWVKVDLAAQAESAGVPLGGLEQLGGNDPTATLNLLRGAGDDLKRLGKAAVRGTPTTHYKGTLDLAKAVDAAPEAKRPELRATIERLGGPNRLPVEVWIDADGRVRQLRSATTPGGTGQGAATVTVEYFDFGVDVQVEPPPADQVADVSELRAS